MATRIEKIFKSDTIRLMDSILNEINILIRKTQNKKLSKEEKEKEWARTLTNITQSICGFYDKNGITDAEISTAVNRRK